MTKCVLPGFTLGCTSYLAPEGYVSGVRRAAARCKDVTLLLFESGGGEGCPLSEAEVGEIRRIGQGEGLTFTVHLPVDGNCCTDEGARRFAAGALAAVERTLPLDPQSYVLHLPVTAPQLGTEPFLPDGDRHVRRVCQVLDRIGAALPAPERLALENLEGQALSFLDPWLAGRPWTRCFDIGHVWKDGGRPEETFALWQPRVRLCHLHGVRPGESGKPPRDHTSLRFVPEAALDACVHALWDADFRGVVTLEVFSLEHFETSWRALAECRVRYEQKHA